MFLSHTGRSSVFRIGSHQLAREMAAAGHDVVHISNPISLAHVAMLRDAEVRRRLRMAVPLRWQVIDGVRYAVPWSVFPLIPDPLRRPLTLGSTTILRRMLHKAGFHRPDLLLVDQPLFDFLVPVVGANTVVYRPTDINAADLARRAEDRLVPRVAGVVATSGVVARALAERFPEQRYAVVENGVETAHFASVGRPFEQRRGAVYVGALDRRFDWDAVVAMACAVPDQPVDLYGPLVSAVPHLPANVRLHGPVDYAEVPAVLAAHRVGLLPLNDDVTNSGRSPMKLYEYLAAGLTVVARATAPMTALGLSDVQGYTDPADAPARLVDGLDRAPSGDGAAAAAAMDWAGRARLLLAECERLAGTGH
ncbi:glycosyltransferase [Nakamurella endophytica]|uniref:glycosyltransferase n=1 Tax=Nakamurella endophytica TaxID=1748367 RepID=UPI001E6518A9|nr:glycosyltransferase [Nakamurella endophytica]